MPRADGLCILPHRRSNAHLGSPFHSFRLSGPVRGGSMCDMICVMNEIDLWPNWVPSLSFPLPHIELVEGLGLYLRPHVLL